MAIQENGEKSPPRKPKKPPVKKPRTMAKAAPRAVKYGPVPPPVAAKPPKKRKPDLSAIGETFKAVARRVVHIGSYAAIIPAVNINLAGSASHDISVANVGFVLGAAVSLDYAFIQFGQRQKARGALALAACALFIAINLNNALSNIAHISGEVKDQAQGQMEHAARLKSNLVAKDREIDALQARRSAQVTLAGGEASVDGIGQELKGLTDRNDKMWQASDECRAINSKSNAQKQLCGDVAALRGRQEAARQRDKIDASITAATGERKAISEKLDAAGGAPSSADPYADNLQAVLPFFGFHMDESQKAAAGPLKNWMWAGGLELLAAIGPVFLSGLLVAMFGLGEHAPAPVNPQPKSEPKADKPKRESWIVPAFRGNPDEDENPADMGEDAGKMPPEMPEETGVKAFRSEELEDWKDAVMMPNELYEVYKAWCAKRDVIPMSAAMFGRRIKDEAHVAYETVNKKTVYKNIRLKQRGLRLVADNG